MHSHAQDREPSEGNEPKQIADPLGVYLVYRNNQESWNGSLKNIDLLDQKTAP